jgi:glycosyltransferase involved in cell wall biosynthesis
LRGFVPDLTAFYRESAFMVAPILGGTGQPTKVLEGMAHGMAVVTLEHVAKLTPLRHGVNGFVARDAKEFAEYTIQLWGDRELCRRMGQAARETIAAEASRGQLVQALAPLVNA